MTRNEAVNRAGSWTAYDPEFPDRDQWHECLHQAFEAVGEDGDWRKHAQSLYRHKLWEVFLIGTHWYVQMPKGRMPFKLRRTAQKFADQNKDIS